MLPIDVDNCAEEESFQVGRFGVEISGVGCLWGVILLIGGPFFEIICDLSSFAEES